MRLKDSVVITNVDDYYVLVDSSASDDRFNGMVKLNETSKSICDYLLTDIEYDDLVESMLNEYNVERQVLEKDIKNALDKLRSINLIIEKA